MSIIEIELLGVEFDVGKTILVPTALHYKGNKNNEADIYYFIFDTGAAVTHISRNVLFDIGYDKFDKDTKLSLSAEGKFTADICKVERIDFGGLPFF